MKKIKATTLLLFFSLLVISQPGIDSIKVIWTDLSRPADQRLESMKYVCDKILLRSNPDSAYIVALEMSELADSSGNALYKAESLRIQGESFHYRGNVQQAISLLEESLQLSINADYKKGIATAYSSIADILTEQGQYTKALDYYNKSLDISTNISDKVKMANTLIAMGIIYYDQGDLSTSQALFERALELNRETDDVRSMGRINNNIGVIYHKLENYDLAKQYFDTALYLFEKAGERRGMASSLNNIGDVYASQGKYTDALPYNMKSLGMREELGDKRGMANCYNVIGSNLTEQGNYTEALDYYLKSAEIREELGEKRAMSRVYGNIGQLYLTQNNYTKSKYWCEKAYELSNKIGAIMEEKEACDCLYGTYKMKGLPKTALKYLERLVELEHELESDETTKLMQEFEFKKIVLEDNLKKEQQNYQMELRYREEVNNKNRQRNIFFFIGLAILALSIGLYSRLRFIRKSRATIQKEKERSEELLLNILPGETASELKLKGFVEAQHFDLVTVMFTDFKGFTQMAEKMSPQELVNEIDHCFKKFDEITSRHHIEKIKTIGDAYMCAGGLPVANATNPVDVVNAALKIQAFMHELKLQKQADDKAFFEIRLGIHTGPVVAGIVGNKKFQYDIWGDTVNIASRMESSGEVGKVNISQSTYQKVKDQFHCVHRGKVVAKGKGEIDMYFVEPKQ